MLKVHPDGSATGQWCCTPLSGRDGKLLKPHSSYESVRLRVANALQRPQNCLLLWIDDGPSDETLNLLVTTLGCGYNRSGQWVLECLYKGTVARATNEMGEPVFVQHHIRSRTSGGEACYNIEFSVNENKKNMIANEALKQYDLM